MAAFPLLLGQVQPISAITPPPQSLPGHFFDLVAPLPQARPSFDLTKLRAWQAEQAKEEAARQAEIAKLAAEKQAAEQAAKLALEMAQGGILTGSVGYSLPYGNCVNTAIAYGKDQPGNPISWYATTRTPFIGAAALFYFNHVGVVVGIWSNGDLEIAQENSPGMPHRLPISMFRGFF